MIRLRKLNEKKKNVKHRVCPHCRKKIIPNPILKKIHYAKSPCGCYTDKCPTTNNKEKVTCKNCIGRIRDLESGFLRQCKSCGYIFPKWIYNDSKYCKECGKPLG